MGTTAVDELVEASTQIADRRYGALIVVEGVTGLQEYVRSGKLLDGEISADLLVNIFFPNTPMHDGAVIIREDRILAAGCLLPLSDNLSTKDLGTRHKAAVGITEQTDAFCIAISEETGTISIARSGHLIHDVSPERLRRHLTVFYGRQIAESQVQVAQ
jgi:diadenylate cyclase